MTAPPLGPSDRLIRGAFRVLPRYYGRMRAAVAEGLTHGPCPYPLDSAPAARWHLERAVRDAGHVLAEVMRPVTDAVAAMQFAVSPGPALTYDGEDARHAATRKPPADPRLRGPAFGARGRR